MRPLFAYCWDTTSRMPLVAGVAVEGGDYYVSELFIQSNSRVTIAADSRVIATLKVTKLAVVHVDNATQVVLEGGGTLYGDAEHDIEYYSAVDDRFQPREADGQRPHLLLINQSSYVTVRGIHLRNSTSWNFRMDQSQHIYVDSVNIYGDSRWPNNVRPRRH